MIVVGIDWSSLHDDVCILDITGRIIKQFRIPVSGPGFAELIETLDGFETRREEVLIGIESSNDLAAKFLKAAGYTVYALNPLSVNRFKERYKVSSKKDDRFDAMNIAMILVKDRDRFTPVMDSSTAARTLRIHCETLDSLIRERTGLINQLKACLMRYFPAYLGFFGNLGSSLSLRFLAEFPSPQELKTLTQESFAARAVKIKQMSAARKNKFFKQIHDIAVFFENPDEPALVSRAVILARRLLSLNEMIDQIERDIEKVFAAHPLAHVFRSVPGAGARLAPNLLACFGDNPERFTSYQQVQCYAGTAPVTKQSGKTFEVQTMRRACNKHFRYILQTLAFTSLKSATWAECHYQSQRSKGKTHSAALRSTANKWAKILFAMWKTGQVYDNALFERARARAA